MTPLLLRLDEPVLDPRSAERLASGRAVGVVLTSIADGDLAAFVQAVRAAAGRANLEGRANPGVPPLVAIALDAWGPPHGPAFDVAARVHELATGGEPLEAMLAALDTGRAMANVGINAAIGPDLGRWLDADADAVDGVLDALVQGLQAAGVSLAPTGLPADAVDLGEPAWRPWAVALAAGLEWLVLESPTPATVTRLRDDLGFGGLIAGRPSAGTGRLDLGIVDAVDATTDQPSPDDDATDRVLSWRFEVLD